MQANTGATLQTFGFTAVRHLAEVALRLLSRFSGQCA